MLAKALEWVKSKGWRQAEVLTDSLLLLTGLGNNVRVNAILFGLFCSILFVFPNDVMLSMQNSLARINFSMYCSITLH